MKPQSDRLKPQNIVFRDYKHFDKQSFSEDLQSFEHLRNSNFPNENLIDFPIFNHVAFFLLLIHMHLRKKKNSRQ